MYAQPNAATGYATLSAVVSDDRSVEYRAFTRANALLGVALKAGPKAMPRLAEAVDFNNRLWTVLAADAADDSNMLPDALRAQIISLSIYAQRTGRAVLRGTANAQTLVDLNITIMRGLRPEGA